MKRRTIASLLVAGALALNVPLAALASEQGTADELATLTVASEATVIADDGAGEELIAAMEAAPSLEEELGLTDEQDANATDEDALVQRLEEDVLVAQSESTSLQRLAEAELDDFAAAHEGDIADGTYAIVSGLSDSYALDVYGNSLSSGARVIIWFKQTTANQRWIIKSVGGGYVTITSASSGKVLDVNGGLPIPTNNIIQWDDKANGSRNQQWIISEESDGSYKITSAMATTDGSRLVLDVYGGVARAETDTCVFVEKLAGDMSNQRWKIEKPLSTQLDEEARLHEGDLPDGTYIISSELGKSLVLDVAGASTDYAAKVVVWPRVPAANEAWEVTHDEDGYVVFTNVYSGKVLDVYGGLANLGAEVIQWSNSGSVARNQRWIVSKEDDGSFKITSAMTGRRLVLDVYGGNATYGAQTIVWEDKGGSPKNQRWSFDEAPAYFDYLDEVPDGTYAVKSALNGKVLDVYGASTEEGASVKLWVKKTESNANQVWYLTQDSRVCSHLENMLSDYQLALSKSAAVQMDTLYDWIVEPAGNGRYFLRDAATDKVLTVESDGTTVSAAIKTGSSAQLWSFEETEVDYDSIYVNGNTRIMGTTSTTQNQAVRYLRTCFSRYGYSLPAVWRNDGETIEKIVSYFWEEGAIEGVRPDIALAQSLHETGYFQFGGDAIPEQYNFAGLGTTGGGVKGNYFGTARNGIRAQIQHLKAYASTAALKQACVDPRFNLVSRGCAPTLSGLSGRWAVPGYGYENGTIVYYHEQIADIANAMAAY